ncbi:hypothetical protein BUALT_Bualt16G0003300 [Buddleja alternifolia]|uniref:Uncharacterized protein n=1 Tax=Buddleja alternifolia TaxID=168488 RepID=A0AAV6WIG8_9LAMI|nr:hypothetical protein BUALT_Bualt16G0003300 [Buddleja alternifolia]
MAAAIGLLSLPACAPPRHRISLPSLTLVTCVSTSPSSIRTLPASRRALPPPPFLAHESDIDGTDSISSSSSCALQCPHFQSCSGCTHEYNLHQPPILDEAMEFFKNIGVSNFTFDTCRLWGWRCRAKLAVRGSPMRPLIGLYEEGTHNVVDIPECQAHHPSINAAVDLLKRAMVELNIEPYDEDEGTGELRYVQMAVTTYNTSLPASERYRNGTVQVSFVWNSRSESSPSFQKLNALANIIFGNRWRHLLGERDFWENVGGIDVSLALFSFGQANTRAFDSPLRKLQKYVPYGASVIDLYAGAGVIGLSLAAMRKCRSIKCVEEPLSWLIGSDVVVVDPPRKGLDPSLLIALQSLKFLKLKDNLSERKVKIEKRPWILREKEASEQSNTQTTPIESQSLPETLIYISCGWDSFKEDCMSLISNKAWHLDKAHGFNFFPGTKRKFISYAVEERHSKCCGLSSPALSKFQPPDTPANAQDNRKVKIEKRPWILREKEASEQSNTQATPIESQSLPETLIYISCGWDSFKEDCMSLISNKAWHLDKAHGFNFFPGTKSGECMENALRACCKGLKIGKILIHRDGDNGKQLIYEKLPNDISERHVLLLDPVFATGNSASQAIELLIQKGVPESHIIFLNLISAPEGIHCVCKRFPTLKIVTSEIYVALNEEFRVIPVFLVLLFHVFHFSSSLENLTLSCKENEKRALFKFKENITNPSGKLSSWNEGDCCKWSGVSCSTKTGHVIKLNLRNMFSSTFEVNPSLLQLNYLSYLDLSMNNFGGAQIPEFFGSFTRLRYLNLSGSSFGGKIPRNLGNLLGLQYLDLRNYCNDPVENGLKWLSGLLSLKYLNLEGVDLHKTSSYWLQTINTFLPSLSELHLSQCQLMNIPFSLPFVNFTSLSVLDLSNNGFNSTIPNWLFNLTNLKILDLNTNNLHGVLPDEFSELNFLENLDLSSNFDIEGPLPKGLGVLCNLQKLSLNENRLSGGVNEVIDGLSQCRNRSLETLNLGDNELNGNIPSSLGLLKNLKYLLLSNNLFTGPIPSSIGNLSSLVVMDLYQNSWEGVITEIHLANLSSLHEISIGKFFTNLSLVFNVSSNWIPPFKLKYVKIQGCKLGPKFPAFLMRNQSDLETVVINFAGISDVIPDWFLEMDLQMNELDLAYNQLSGRVPNMIKFNYASNVDLSSNNFEGPLPLWSSNLTTLYLRDNKFSGTIPENIGTALPYLTDLDISRNNLNGTIPLSMGNLTELTTLVISSNQLHGKIPDFWAKLQMLYILDMSNNNLSGAIPGSIGFLSILKFLVLSNNSFSGKLPSSLRNCTELASLDLGDNNLSGKIPPWIGLRMTSLLILRLRNNSFTGRMPSQICNLSVLHILDIARNSLSGKIPACFGDLEGFKRNTSSDIAQYQGRLEIVAKGRALQYYSTLYLVNSIDLSGNNFSGEIPSEITILVRLQTLILSMNHLTGKIPPSIERLKWVETLDLSKNRLSGPIPPGMTSLTFLNHLNLSYNNLSGQIPTGNQFLTLNDPSIYEGNALLCGFPLSAECNRGTEIAPFPDENVAETDGDDKYEKLLLSVFVGLGFFVGFWGVCGSLIVKKQWRDAFFSFCERVMERILDIFSSNAWLRRKFRGIVSAPPRHRISLPSLTLVTCVSTSPSSISTLPASRRALPPPPFLAHESDTDGTDSISSSSSSCALHCPHFQSCSGCIHEYNLHQPPILDEAMEFFKNIGVSNFTFDTCRLWGWRCRAKLAVRGSPMRPLIGLYEEGTHNVVDIPECQAHHPSINAAVDLLKRAMVELNIEPYDEDEGTGELRYVQMAVTTYNTSLPASERYRNGTVQVSFVWNSRSESSPSFQKLNALANIIFGNRWRHLLGERDFWENVGGIDAFDSLLRKLQKYVPYGASVVDLYAGAGVIGLSLAAMRKCRSIKCVEVNKEAKLSFEKTASRLPTITDCSISWHHADTSKKYADVIIPRGGANHVAIDLIVQHIHTKLGQHDLCKIYPNVNVIQSTFQVVEHGLGHLPFTEKQIVTPTGSVYTGVDFCKKLCGVSIVRDNHFSSLKQLIYEKLPNDISERHVLLLDPVLATGARGNTLCLETFPTLKMVTSEIDVALNEEF